MSVWREALRRHREMSWRDRLATYAFLYVGIGSFALLLRNVREFFDGEPWTLLDVTIGVVVLLVEAGVVVFSGLVVWVGHFQRTR